MARPALAAARSGSVAPMSSPATTRWMTRPPRRWTRRAGARLATSACGRPTASSASSTGRRTSSSSPRASTSPSRRSRTSSLAAPWSSRPSFTATACKTRSSRSWSLTRRRSRRAGSRPRTRRRATRSSRASPRRRAPPSSRASRSPRLSTSRPCLSTRSALPPMDFRSGRACSLQPSSFSAPRRAISTRSRRVSWTSSTNRSTRVPSCKPGYLAKSFPAPPFSPGHRNQRHFVLVLFVSSFAQWPDGIFRRSLPRAEKWPTLRAAKTSAKLRRTCHFIPSPELIELRRRSSSHASRTSA
mmetsp:Transcript_16420/g.46669  ORF Transcript_16420/g.46669 Transcript_16420/m.46669 type:complete len:300 (+) Transcript_16420:687-1586(+)